MVFELEPVKRDKFGRKVADYDTRHFYEKIAEELLEAHDHAVDGGYWEAYELLDVMTACATRINALNIQPEKLKNWQLDIIKNNRARGYFDD